MRNKANLQDRHAAKPGGVLVSVNAIEKATGSLEVLIRLYFQGPTQKSQLFGELRLNHETFAKTLRTLRDLGLVQCEAERFFPYRHLCGLANVGRKLVDSPWHRWPALPWDGGNRSRERYENPKSWDSAHGSRAIAALVNPGVLGFSEGSQSRETTRRSVRISCA